MDPERITYFGETDSRSKRVKFGIKAKDRTRHVYVIGKTGMGKSTLLENMAIQDLKNGEGMAFMDPHGKTAELLLDYVPPERMKDVVYFAPFDTDYPITFNVLEDVGYDKRHLVVSGLMSTFKKIWVDAWSARMEYILTNTLLALIEYPGATLLGVNRMLADKDYRKKVVENVKDPSVKSFWVDEFAKYTDKFAAEATPAIQNKIGQFTSNPLIRNIVGQPKSSIDIRKMMDEKKILIINLSKGKVGESNANLLGSMLITKIYLAAMSRADVPEKKLKLLPNFYLFVDEFQSFANESFADILSEARKYKLNLTIAHQYIEQMSDEVRAAVFGNVGTFITFRVGAIDAEVLEKEFAPQFTAEDLVNLGIFQMYLKLMIDGVSSVPFSASSLPPFPEPVISYKTEIVENSRKQFAKPRTGVELDINSWHEEGKGPTEWQKKQEKVGKFTPQSKAISSAVSAGFNNGANTSREKSYSNNNYTQKPSQAKPVVMPIAKTESVGKQAKLAGAEIFDKDVEDDFVPLKTVAPKIIAQEKKAEQIADKNPALGNNKDFPKKDGKIMSKENLTALQSALQQALKNNTVQDSRKNEKAEKSAPEGGKGSGAPTPSPSKPDQTSKPSAEELKKVLGVE
jgi:energy-coupling factor transporter ATP-binding protein EcfA2